MSICGHLGSYNTSSTRTHVGFQFSTHAAAGGNVAPNSAFEAADIRIYKATDGAAFSATQRSSANGITMTSPFDSLVGVHDVDIDLTDNTDASFYAASCRYSVVLAPDETVDGQTITGIVLASFEIGPPQVNVTQFGGTAGTFSSGRPEVNTSHVGGTSQTAKDLGAINVTNLNTLSGHDPGATIGTSTLTQTQVSGGAYALNSSSFAFNSAVDLTTTMKASVNAEVVDCLNVDTYAEIGQEAPAATQTIRKMLQYAYKAWRNKKTQTATTYSLFADDASTVDQKATVSDDGTTTTVGEVATGP